VNNHHVIAAFSANQRVQSPIIDEDFN